MMVVGWDVVVDVQEDLVGVVDHRVLVTFVPSVARVHSGWVAAARAVVPHSADPSDQPQVADGTLRT